MSEELVGRMEETCTSTGVLDRHGEIFPVSSLFPLSSFFFILVLFVGILLAMAFEPRGLEIPPYSCCFFNDELH
jgi:hypothetical protein